MPYTPAKVKEIQQRNNFKYWKLTDATGKNEYDSMLDQCSLDESVEILQSSIADIEDQNYCKVKLFEKIPEKLVPGSKAGNSAEFLIKLDRKSNLPTINHANPMIPSFMDVWKMQQDSQNQLFEAKMELMKLQYEMENQTQDSTKELLTLIAPMLLNTQQAPKIQEAQISQPESEDIKQVILQLDPKEGEETYRKFIERIKNKQVYDLLKSQL